jgi:lysozyme family protein
MTDNIKKKLLGKYGEDYVRALSFTSSAEGSFSYREADTGGMTYKGISRKWNPKWVGWVIIDRALEKYPELKIPYKKPPASIHKLNFELNANEELEYLVYDFYYENYYTKCGAWNIGGKLAVVLFDMATLQGVRRASKSLQKCLNIHFKTNLVVDSQVGATTIKVLNEVIKGKGLDIVVDKLIYEMKDNLIEASKLDGNEENYNGWMNRISHLSNYLRKL